jgi:hypothetical protein
MSAALNSELGSVKRSVESKAATTRDSVGEALSDANFWRDSFGLLFFVLAGVALV